MTKTHEHKNWTLWINAFLVIFSILTMGFVTFAWMTTSSTSVDRVVLNSGNQAMTVDALAYNQDFTRKDGAPVPMAYSKNAGSVLYNAQNTYVDGEGYITVSFNSSTLSSFNMTSLYDNELSMNEDNFPHLYVELRYIKPSLDGFIKAAVSDISFASAYGNTVNALTADSTGTAFVYQYRYVTKKNQAGSTYYNNVIQAAEADTSYQSSAWTNLTTTGFSLFRNDKDLADYSYDENTTSLESQCYVPGFAYQYSDNGTNTYYYSKATLLEIRIDPMSWVSYYHAHPNAHASQLNFGVNFKITLNFSNDAYESSTITPKVTSTKKSMILGVGQSDTSTLAAYNFPNYNDVTYSPSSSNSSVATASVSGTTLTVTAGSTPGTATITITTYPRGNPSATEQAVTSIAVQVYDGPTLIIDPTVLSITRGSIGSIKAQYVLFSGTPTLTVTSTDTSIAEPSVNGTAVTVKGNAKGSATLTLTATYANGGTTETSTKTCPVTVISIVKTVTSIAVTSLPTTTTYALGSAFNSSGLVITATYDDASTASVTGYSLSPSNGSLLNTLGTQAIQVTYAGFTTSFNVSVVQSLRTLSSIAVTTNPTKSTYNVGESFASSGLVVTGTFSDSTTETLTGYTLSINGVTISDGSPLSNAGAQTVNVDYQGYSTTFNITVNASNVYTLVTDTAQLTVNDSYLIVNSATAGAAQAMSTVQNANNRGQIDVTISSTFTIDPTGISAESLTLTGTAGAYELRTSTSGYLVATSSSGSNLLRTDTTSSTLSKWTISVAASGIATIMNTGRSDRNYLRYNSQYSIFSCYNTTTGTDVFLYRKPNQ